MKIVRVREYRKALGLTQAQLGELCGLGHSTIGDIESGAHAPTIWIALRIADALKSDIRKLFEIK